MPAKDFPFFSTLLQRALHRVKSVANSKRSLSVYWIALGVLLLIICITLVAREGQPSLRLLLSEFVVGWSGKMEVETFRLRYLNRKYPEAPLPTRGLLNISDVRVEVVQGRAVYTFTPKAGGTSQHIIYTHGGAYVNTLQKPHWDIIEALIRTTGATVTAPLYPLAPEHQYVDAYQFLEATYRAVLEDIPAKQVVFAGDSAGGGLALGQVFRYREIGLPLPGHVVLFSPWLDVTLSNPASPDAELRDVMLGIDWLREAGKWWSGESDPRVPLVSPIFGGLSGLPPIHVYIGTHDLFLSDARQLRDLVTQAGGEIDLKETPGGFHVFMAATFTPEAKEVYSQVAEAISLDMSAGF